MRISVAAMRNLGDPADVDSEHVVVYFNVYVKTAA